MTGAYPYLLTVVGFFASLPLSALAATSSIEIDESDTHANSETSGGCRISGRARHPGPTVTRVSVTLGAAESRSTPVLVNRRDEATGKCCFSDWQVELDRRCERPVVRVDSQQVYP